MKRSPASAHAKRASKQKNGKTVPAPKRIYVRSRMDAWSSLKISNNFGSEISLSGEGLKSCGFLIAFRTKKAFRAQHPKETPLVFNTSKA